METTGGGTADEETQRQQLTPNNAPQTTAQPTGRRRVAKVADEPRIGPDPQAAAFFDLDNTMIQGASMFYLAKGSTPATSFPGRRSCARSGISSSSASSAARTPTTSRRPKPPA